MGVHSKPHTTRRGSCSGNVDGEAGQVLLDFSGEADRLETSRETRVFAESLKRLSRLDPVRGNIYYVEVSKSKVKTLLGRLKILLDRVINTLNY